MAEVIHLHHLQKENYSLSGTVQSRDVHYKVVWPSRRRFACVCTQKCRFMDKEVREILRFFVAPRRTIPLSVWRGFSHILIHKYLHLSRLGLGFLYHRALYAKSLVLHVYTVPFP